MPGRREVRLNHAVRCQTILREASDLFSKGGEDFARGLMLFDDKLPNIQQAHEWVAAQSAEDEEAATLCSSYPFIGELLVYLRLPPRDRIKWGEAALAAARRIKDRPAAAAHLHKLALTYLDRGEIHRTIPYLEEAVVINREISRPEYEAADLGALGLAYAALGEHRKAIKFYRQSLSVYRVIEARWGEGIYLSNLGDSCTAIGKARTAIKLHNEALKINREVNDHRSEGYALGNLAKAYAALGDHHRALELFKENLAIARELIDPQSEGYALFGSSLSLWQIGDLAGAMANAEAALEVFERIEDICAGKVRDQLSRWRAKN